MTSESSSVRYSRLWERLGAVLPDSLLIYPVMMILYLWTDTMVENKWIHWIFPALYFVLLEGPFGNGQTLGKRLFGLRVLTKEGQVLSYPQSLKRYLIASGLPGLLTMVGFEYLSMPGFIGWAALALQQAAALYVLMDGIVMILDPQKRSLHDYLSGTVVLKTRSAVPDAWPDYLEPLSSTLPWKRRALGIPLVTLLAGLFATMNMGFQRMASRLPAFSYSQALIPTGVIVQSARLQGDPVELDVSMAQYPFMGRVSRRPERVSHRLELATRRLIARGFIDPKTSHRVLYWVRASRHLRTGPADRWTVDTETLSSAFLGAEVLEGNSQPVEVDRVKAKPNDVTSLLKGIRLPLTPEEKDEMIRKGQDDGFEACMKEIYPGNPYMAQPIGWTSLTLDKNRGCEVALSLVSKFVSASLNAYFTTLTTTEMAKGRLARIPQNPAEHREMGAAASKGINACLGWIFGNDFAPKVLPDSQTFESIGYQDPSDGCRQLTLLVIPAIDAAKHSQKK